LISTQALFPYALDKWLGINGNWFLLFGGAILIVTLIQNPEGVAGAFYRRTHRRAAVRRESPSPAMTEPPTRRRPEPEPERDRRQGATVLRVNGLSVAFGGVHALNDVDIEVREGELVGLIGPNGAGKTTLVDAVTGFVRFTGTVELDGRDVGRMPPYQRARLGLGRTWQSTDLFDDLDVRENLTVADGTGEVDAKLSLVGLDVAGEAMPGQLSQGQRKLVGIARALASNPRVLCLDEPAAGLDTNESQELGARLRELADRGQSTLLIDHDMGLVLSICDRVVVLEFGRVIAVDAPDVVRRDPNVISAYLGGGSQSDAVAGPNGRGSLAL
jgi:ABC-type branched-subunit amino acid transport system ATPase component